MASPSLQASMFSIVDSQGKAIGDGLLGNASTVLESAPLPPTGQAEEKQTTEDSVKRRKKRRLRKIVKPPSSILKYVWLGAHVGSLVFGLMYILMFVTLNKLSLVARVSYRLTFVLVVVAYTLSLHNKFGTNLPSYFLLLSGEAFQYLVLAVVWLFTFPSLMKLVPFYLVAVLQVAAFFKIRAVLHFDVTFAKIIAYDELVIIVYLLCKTLTFRSTSGYQLVLFCSFYWLRVLYSPATHALVLHIVQLTDKKIATVKNEKVVKYWGDFKTALEKQTKQHQEYAVADKPQSKE